MEGKIVTLSVCHEPLTLQLCVQDNVSIPGLRVNPLIIRMRLPSFNWILEETNVDKVWLHEMNAQTYGITAAIPIYT